MKESFCPGHIFTVFPSLVFFLLVTSCSNIRNDSATSTDIDSLTEEQRHLSEYALAGLTAYEGLQVTTMATEPMLKNPTNIDVDDRGRVWVTEAINYRPDINGNPTNPQGDRIIILEDLTGDGIADTTKVFYQGPEINSPLGICVLGNRVIVSQSPYVWNFYDDDGDDRADRKEIMFQGIGGEQHDHGAHSFTFGPDGKLYFNFGNEGRTLKDKNGRTVIDQDGDEITEKKYREGMIMRCDPDGSNVEVLAHNFRNPFEVAVDSYGNLWQSDNDDDGNRGTRINFILEYGNYGFKDEITNASWPENRTNMEDSIPLRHWHLNDPGVVPNLLQTYAGSPCGIVLYEGSLMPSIFHNQMIHAEPGNNVIRSYTVHKTGAGFTANIQNILKGGRDQWFRPADVCVAPDGSLIIADWYDPGVGGHQAGDQSKGRIYRVAPRKSKYVVPAEDYRTVSGAIQALKNPNLSVRYKAWTALQAMGPEAVPELEKLWNSSDNATIRARAFWVLVKSKDADENKYIKQAVNDKNPALKIMGLKAARQINQNLIPVIRQLSKDPDQHVRRECAIALHHINSPDAAEVWSSLARMHDGKDRWYLEALGIGAHDQWDNFFPVYIASINNPLVNESARDIIWRARCAASLPYLSKLASDSSVPLKSRLRYFRAFDFNPAPEKSQYLLAMFRNEPDVDTAVSKLLLRHLDPKTVHSSPIAKNALQKMLSSTVGSMEYLELVRKFDLKTENRQLLEIAIQKSQQYEGRQAAGLLLSAGGSKLIWKTIDDKDTTRSLAMVAALGRVGSKESIEILRNLMLAKKYPMIQRQRAAANLGRSGGGEDLALEMLQGNKVPEVLVPQVVSSVQGSWKQAVRERALSYLPASKTKASRKEPVIAEINSLTGDAASGKKIYTNVCAVCHKVNNAGFDFGPDLSEIGAKYPKEGLLESIVNPSKGISFGYESWELKMKDGSTLGGIVASKSESEVLLKYPGGSKQQIKRSDIASMNELKESMMPEDLHQSLSNQDLADLLEYLAGLKKK